MQRAASDGTPRPASTITGQGSFLMIRRMLVGLRTPSVVPMGAPSGITAAAPASCSRIACTTSSLV